MLLLCLLIVTARKVRVCVCVCLRACVRACMRACRMYALRLVSTDNISRFITTLILFIIIIIIIIFILLACAHVQ